MHTKLLMTTHVAGLLAIAGSSVAEGAYGADVMPIVVQTIVALAAAAIVIWRRRPTVGLVVAAWLALGPIAMPFVKDNLNSGKPGLVVSTVVCLVAIVSALAGGALALVAYRRRPVASLGDRP